MTRRPRVENDERSSSLRGIRRQLTVTTKVCWFVTPQCREQTEAPRACFLSLTLFSQKEEALGFHLSHWEFVTSKEEVQTSYFWSLSYLIISETLRLLFFMHENRNSFCDLWLDLTKWCFSYARGMTLCMTWFKRGLVQTETLQLIDWLSRKCLQMFMIPGGHIDFGYPLISISTTSRLTFSTFNDIPQHLLDYFPNGSRQSCSPQDVLS